MATKRPHIVVYEWLDSLPAIKGTVTRASYDSAALLMDELQRSAEVQGRPLRLTYSVRGGTVIERREVAARGD